MIVQPYQAWGLHAAWVRLCCLGLAYRHWALLTAAKAGFGKALPIHYCPVLTDAIPKPECDDSSLIASDSCCSMYDLHGCEWATLVCYCRAHGG